VFRRYKDDKDCILYEILSSPYEDAKIELESFLQVGGSEKTFSSIRIVLNSNLKMFTDIRVKELTRKPTINLSLLRKEKAILYIQIPERHSQYFSQLSASFLTQLLDKLMDDKEGMQTYVMIDEFANIGYIPNICETLSTCRKRNISISVCLQSLAQLKRVYGEFKAEELKELFKTLIIAGGLRGTAEWISSILGVKKIHENNTSRTEPLLTSDEIRRLDSDKVLVICGNKCPVIDYMIKKEIKS
jgi:type IV secretion system protein VirD4